MSNEHIYTLRLKNGDIHIMQLFPVNGQVPDVADEIKRLVYADDIESWKRIQREDIPLDRTFRNAWGHDLKVDMGKAREIVKNKLRELRAPVLSKLDVDYQRADEDGDTTKKKEIVARKKILRDVTKDPKIINATTTDELKEALNELKKLL